METERKKFLKELQCRLTEKTPEEQEAEQTLANFVKDAEEFAIRDREINTIDVR